MKDVLLVQTSAQLGAEARVRHLMVTNSHFGARAEASLLPVLTEMRFA
jgi:hypothetical protein